MSRKAWIVIVSIGVVAVLVAGAGVAALFLVPQYRARNNITQARTHAAAAEWEQARWYYQEYLFRNDDDLQALEEYIEVCKAFETDRRRSLLAAGRAYVKLAQKEPEVQARKEAVLDFYRDYQFWPELEYAISLFYGSDRDALDAELAYDRAVAIESQGRTVPAVEEYVAYLGQVGRAGAPLRDAPLRLARLYRSQGKDRDAQALFGSLFQEYPDDGQLHAQHANYLMDAGELEAARAALGEVPEASRGTREYLLGASRLAGLDGNTEEALAYSQQALALEPDRVDVQLNYTMALERAGKREEAIAYIEAMDPMHRLDTPGFMMFLMELKLEASDLEEAGVIREAYIRAYPDQRFLDEYLKGRIAFADGKNDRAAYEEARDRFIMAVEMNPNLDRARFFLALTELELGNPGAARNALDMYLKKNPGDEQARRLWTRNFDASKSLLELRFAGKRLLESPAPALETLLFTAQDLMSHRREEDGELTRDLFEKAIAVAPSDARGYSALAAYYLDRDETGAAEEVLARAAAAGVPPSSFPLLNTNILLSRGEIDAAVALASESLADAEFSEVRTWALFFARHRYLKEADALLASYMARAGDAAKASVLPYRLNLALRFGSREDAAARLEAAEAELGAGGEHAREMNDMRLTVARSLMGRRPIDREAIGALLQKVEASNPSDHGLVVARARLALNDDLPNYDAAADAVAGIPESADAYNEAQLLLAEIAHRRGRFEDVVRIAGDVLSRSAQNTMALYLLGEAQLGLRKPEEARAAMEQILEIDRGDLRALRMLVRIYTDLQLPQKAEATLARFEELAALEPGMAAGVGELRAYRARGEGEVAASEDQLRQELAANPDNYAAMTGLVRSLVGRARFEEALGLVDAYLEGHPNEAEAWVFLGQVLLEQGAAADLAKASTAFTRAQILVPEHGAAQLGLVDVQIRMNQIELAVSMCRRYLKNRPDERDVLFRLASLLSRNPDNHGESLEAIQRAIELGERPEFIRLRAYLYTRLDRPADAVADLERLRGLLGRLTPDDELTLAEAHLGLGDLVKARASATAARAAIPGGDSRLLARANIVEAQIAAPEASP